MINIIEPSELQPSNLENRSDLVIGEGASASKYFFSLATLILCNINISI